MLGTDDAETALQEISQVIENHEQWCDDLTHALVCRLTPDPRDVAADDQRCRFGQWYGGPAGRRLAGYSAFAALDAEHRQMHRLAARLFEELAAGGTIVPADHEAFATMIHRFQLHLRALEHEVEQAIRLRDPLTGAESRAGMMTVMQEALALVRRRVHPCCVAMMDLDQFKHVNDTHGHLVGDQVLRGVVAHLHGHLRQYDHVFRYGGEEFLLLLTNVEAPAAMALIERIRSSLVSVALAHDAGAPVFITASFGMTALDPYSDLEASIDRADRALYFAKNAGRNAIRFWETPGPV